MHSNYFKLGNLNSILKPHYKLPIFHFLIPVGFILGQAEKEGRQGGWANGGVVHFIAGIKDEYNKIAFIDLQNNNIDFIWCTNGSNLLINSHICTCPFNTVNFLP